MPYFITMLAGMIEVIIAKVFVTFVVRLPLRHEIILPVESLDGWVKKKKIIGYKTFSL